MLKSVERGCGDTVSVLCPSTFPEDRAVIREGMTEANAVEQEAAPSSKRLLNVPNLEASLQAVWMVMKAKWFETTNCWREMS